MRDRIALVGANRRLVMRDRIVEDAVLQEQVADVGQGRRETRHERERRGEVAQRLFARAGSNVRDAALVEDERPLLVVARRRQHGRKTRNGQRGIAPFELNDGPFEGIRRSSKVGQPSAQSEHETKMLTIDVVTLFPEMFAPAIGLSIVGRALERGLVDIRIHQLLDFCESERADDTPYGGGAGMVMRLEPLARALDSILSAAPRDERRALVLTSPTGKQLVQADARRFAGLDRLVVVCGRYEGVDERLAALYPVEEISLGDFILTGGEIPALAIVDATVRLIEGAIRPESAQAESFAQGQELDFPAYTRPTRFRGVEVPEVLLSGDHAKIAAWRREESRRRATRRKDAQ